MQYEFLGLERLTVDLTSYSANHFSLNSGPKSSVLEIPEYVDLVPVDWPSCLAGPVSTDDPLREALLDLVIVEITLSSLLFFDAKKTLEMPVKSGIGLMTDVLVKRVLDWTKKKMSQHKTAWNGYCFVTMK
jgi:hypothetical protein